MVLFHLLMSPLLCLYQGYDPILELPLVLFDLGFVLLQPLLHLVKLLLVLDLFCLKPLSLGLFPL